MKAKNILKDYFVFYKDNLKKKHIIIYGITLLIFAFITVIFLNNLDETKSILLQMENAKGTSNILTTIIKEKIPIVFLLVFSGITPFIYIPVIGMIGYPYILAIKLVDMSVLNIVLAIVGSVVQLFAVSLAIAAGIYYCTCSTKKFRYDQSATLTFDDVKLSIYEATKKENKINELKEKMKSKKEKKAKLNVKINYKAIITTTVISSIIVMISALITGV